MAKYQILQRGGVELFAEVWKQTLYLQSLFLSFSLTNTFLHFLFQIGGINLRTHEFSTVSKDKKWIRDSIGVSYDGFDNRVYWTNVQTGNQAIVSSKIDGSDVR